MDEMRQRKNGVKRAEVQEPHSQKTIQTAYIYEKKDGGEMKIVGLPLQPSLFFSSCEVFFLLLTIHVRCACFSFSALQLAFYQLGKVSNTRTRRFRDSVDIRIKLAVFIGFELHIS